MNGLTLPGEIEPTNINRPFAAMLSGANVPKASLVGASRDIRSSMSFALLIICWSRSTDPLDGHVIQVEGARAPKADLPTLAVYRRDDLVDVA